MEFTLFFIALFLLFLLKHFIEQMRKTFASRKKLPPVPWKLPLVGNLLQLGTSPHRSITNLAKKHGPIIYLQLGEIPTIVISSASLAKEALIQQDLALANRPSSLATKIMFYDDTDIGFSPYGNYWKQMRKICTTQLLSVKKVQSFRSIREKEVHEFIESIQLSSGSAINLSKKIFLLQNVIVSKATIGNELSFPQDELIDIIVGTLAQTASFSIGDLFPSFKLLHSLFGSMSRLHKMHQKLDKILDKIIIEHKQKLGEKAVEAKEDVLDVLLRLQETNGLEFPITSNNVKAIIMDMFAAGTDTSSTTIEWAMAQMMRNKRVMDKAQDELRQVLKGKKIIYEADIQDLTYVQLVIKETLRLYPPPFLLPRQCREQCEVGGYKIPIKTQLIVNAWAIGRDPKYWQEPESFMPERFENTSLQFNGSNFEYIPFGAGRRMCPGMSFGLATVELTLAQLLYHFDWKLANGVNPEDLNMSEKFGVTIKMKNKLHVVATPYPLL